MQNDFIDGSLKNGHAEEIIPEIAKEMETGNYDLICFTQDTHSELYKDTQEGHKLPIEHCIKNTHGWEVRDELVRKANEIGVQTHFIQKNTFGFPPISEEIFSQFHNFMDDDYEITIVGTCTDICVVSNALILKANMPEAQIYVIEKCCAGTTEENHNAAIAVMRSCQIDII